MSEPVKDPVLDLPVDYHGRPWTIRKYLMTCLLQLWIQGETFSGKRPLGDSGWRYDLYESLIRAGLVEGKLDEDGCVDEVEYYKADALIRDAIKRMGPVEEDEEE